MGGEKEQSTAKNKNNGKNKSWLGDGVPFHLRRVKPRRRWAKRIWDGLDKDNGSNSKKQSKKQGQRPRQICSLYLPWDGIDMGEGLRFLWNATRGDRLRPWRSAYLRWRLETYSGQRADTVTARDFWRLFWTEKRQLFRFLRWTREIKGYAGTVKER